MNIKIEVSSVALREIKWHVKGTGEERCMFEQTAYLHRPDKPYPQEFKMTLPDDRRGKPYDIGVYTISPESIFVDQRKFNKLGISPVLLPAK